MSIYSYRGEITVADGRRCLVPDPSQIVTALETKVDALATLKTSPRPRRREPARAGSRVTGV